VRTALVVGTVVSTVSSPSLDGRTLLLCDYTDGAGVPDGQYVIAVDTIGAGVGERVLVFDEGNGARQILADADAPIRAVVVGVIDEVALADLT